MKSKENAICIVWFLKALWIHENIDFQMCLQYVYLYISNVGSLVRVPTCVVEVVRLLLILEHQ